jgi:hypothetical protein
MQDNVDRIVPNQQSVNRSRTDNAMAKKKEDKRTSNNYKTLSRSSNMNPLKRGLRVSSFCFTRGTRFVISLFNFYNIMSTLGLRPSTLYEETFRDTKGVISSRRSKDK